MKAFMHQLNSQLAMVSESTLIVFLNDTIVFGFKAHDFTVHIACFSFDSTNSTVTHFRTFLWFFDRIYPLGQR